MGKGSASATVAERSGPSRMNPGTQPPDRRGRPGVIGPREPGAGSVPG